ncbi:MAG: pseudouridine synthase [Sphaerochaetaceae bacterium]|nr:pseudouridine synthase [Spirochaetales bacterium]MDY5499928.1 pseudouridine synthase [Sphaerochaetaceae bacterium]
MQRLDKLLADADVASRSALKSIIRSGRITVDGVVVKDPSLKVEEEAVLALDGEPVEKKRRMVCMLYKPAGYVTSTKDKDPTVMELVPEEMRKMDLAPVGRLDKDTEGLLLMTNDGVLAHKLTSPKAKVSKVYYVEHEGTATQEDVEAFQKGIVLKDGEECMPAILRPMGPGKSELVLGEGKYHQVKRMMASRNLSVTYLKRVKEGGLTLGNLEKGQMRELRAEEEVSLFQE